MRSSIVTGVAAVLAFLAPGGLSHAEPHAAAGSRVDLHLPLNPRYPGSAGAQTLTDGITGGHAYGQYLGFEGPDVEITVHLAQETAVHTIAEEFLQATTPAIFLPVSVDIAVSENGTNFRTVATLPAQASPETPGPLVERFAVTGLDLRLRAVRLRAANGGKVPPGHRAPQALRWIFISEILVNPGEAPPDPLTALAAYRVGDSRQPLTAVEAQLRAADPPTRQELCAGLSRLLADAAATPDARRFCLEQLALFGGAEAVPAIVPLLSDPLLDAAAIRALAVLGVPAATEALSALAAHPGDRGRRAEALASLGARRAASLPELALFALTDPDLTPAAVAALARHGSAAAATVLSAALPDADGPLAAAIADALLACGRDLAASGEAEAAREAFGTVRRQASTPLLQLAGLAAVALELEPEALRDLVPAAAAPPAPLSRAALSYLVEGVRRRGPAALGTAFDALPAPAQVTLVDAVCARRVADDLPWLRGCLASPHPDVQAAGLRALGTVGGAAEVPVLVAALADDSALLRRAAEEALGRLGGADTDARLLAAAQAAPARAQAALASEFADRGLAAYGGDLLLAWGLRADAETTRRAAWKALARLAGPGDLARFAAVLGQIPEDALGEAARTMVAAARAEPDAERAAAALGHALGTTGDPARRAVLATAAGAAPSPGSLSLLREVLRDPAAELRTAGVRALAAWPDALPAVDLIAAAAGETQERLAIFMLSTGLVLVTRHGSSLDPGVPDALLADAARLVRREEERQALLEAAVRHPGPAAAEIILAGAAAVPSAASGSALLRSAADLWPQAPQAVLEALQRLAAEAASAEDRQRAADLLARLPGAELSAQVSATPWTPLFDGRTLAGWRAVNGRPDAWAVEDGLLIARAGGGGWLARVDPASDYLIELEFRLPPGGNSGLFLRPPLEGNPAWEGMEVQLLDDAAPQYANLRPEQYCGALYGIAGPRSGLARSAETWQHLRVLCAGRRVAVWLNGFHAAEADLDLHADKAERIRGMARTHGYPGLQNEHGPIAFRNLRMKRLGTPGQGEQP